MKELLNEWRKFLAEEEETEVSRDIKLSNDAYAMLVLMYLGNFDTDPNLKKKRITYLKEKTKVFFPFTQIEEAEKEATELRKNLTKFLKTYLPPQEKKNLTVTHSGWRSSATHSSVRDIFWSRATNFSESSGNKNIANAFDIGFYYTNLYKLITVPISFTNFPEDAIRTSIQKDLDVIDKECEGAYELLEKLRTYNKAFDIQDDEDKQRFAMLFFSGAHDPYNLMQIESLLETFASLNESKGPDREAIKKAHEEREKERHEKWLKSLTPKQKESYEALKKRAEEYGDYLEQRKKKHAEYIKQKFPHGRGRTPDMPVHGTGKKMFEKKKRRQK